MIWQITSTDEVRCRSIGLILEYLQRQDEILKLLESEPIFNKSVNYYQGREDRLKRALERGKRATQLSKKYKWGMEEYAIHLTNADN